MQIVGKNVIPVGVIVTRRIEIVSNAVSGRPSALAAAVAIAPLTTPATTGVSAARSAGSTSNIMVENTLPAVIDPIVPGDGTTSQILLATAVMLREGTSVKT